MFGWILFAAYAVSVYILISIKKPFNDNIEIIAIILWPLVALFFLSDYIYKKYWSRKILRNPKRFQSTKSKFKV